MPTGGREGTSKKAIRPQILKEEWVIFPVVNDSVNRALQMFSQRAVSSVDLTRLWIKARLPVGSIVHRTVLHEPIF